MEIDESTLSTEEKEAILTANGHILSINKLLKKLESISESKLGIESTQSRFAERLKNLQIHERRLSGDLALFVLNKGSLEEQLRGTTIKSERKYLTRQIRSMEDTIASMKAAIAKTRNEAMLLSSSTTTGTLQSHTKKLTLAQVSIVKKLAKHINAYRVIRKNLLEEYNLRIPEINLSDCVESMASGKIHIKSNAFNITRIINEEPRLMGYHYIENGNHYILEEC